MHLWADPAVVLDPLEIGHMEIRVLYSLDEHGPWLTRHKSYDHED